MSRDRLILGFDTSAAHCAAALLSGDRIVAARREEMARGQAERLMPLLEEMLAEAGCAWRDLSALAVGVGPGNFTGIRISVAAARGLALSLGCPAHGVSGFEAVAEMAAAPALACLPAPRAAVYLQGAGDVGPSAPLLCAVADLAGLGLAPGLACAGPGAEAVAAVTGGPVLHRAAPSAEAILRVAAGRGPEAAARPAPLYVRPADAAPARDAAPALLP